jgi:quercetin dioxygenase-like cupin family protein
MRIESDGAGGSRMVDVEMDQTEVVGPRGATFTLTDPIATTEAIFFDFPEDFEPQPHQAPRQQLVIVVSGMFECETTDGDVRRLGPGSVVLAADTEGAGHITRVLEPPGRLLIVPTA